MVDEKQFLQNFAEQFEETDASVFTVETRFRDLEEWSSLIALSIMAMCDEEYNVILTANEMESASKISDLYKIVCERYKG